MMIKAANNNSSSSSSSSNHDTPGSIVRSICLRPKLATFAISLMFVFLIIEYPMKGIGWTNDTSSNSNNNNNNNDQQQQQQQQQQDHNDDHPTTTTTITTMTELQQQQQQEEEESQQELQLADESRNIIHENPIVITEKKDDNIPTPQQEEGGGGENSNLRGSSQQEQEQPEQVDEEQQLQQEGGESDEESDEGEGEAMDKESDEEDDDNDVFQSVPLQYLKEGEEEIIYKLNDMPKWWIVSKVRGADCLCPHECLDANASNDVILYSPTWHDRSGAVIRRMINNLAYAYKYGYIYGGSIPRISEEEWDRHQLVHETLIESIGLQDTLQFIEPNEHDNNVNHFYYIPDACTKFIEYTTEFLDHLRSLVVDDDDDNEDVADLDNNNNNNEPLQVAVHIRRGDAHPCTGYVLQKERYSPNAFFLMALDEYIPNDQKDTAIVTIYSQEDSFEDFTEFSERGYILALDTSPADAWYAMSKADILIPSPNSFFSYVPALVNPNKVYSDTPAASADYVPTFINIDSSIKQRSEDILDNIIATPKRCNDWLQQNPQHRANVTYW